MEDILQVFDGRRNTPDLAPLEEKYVGVETVHANDLDIQPFEKQPLSLRNKKVAMSLAHLRLAVRLPEVS